MDQRSKTPAAGTDTPTGTDPDAKYEQPGYEDKSFGQAVDADTELAERISAQEDDAAVAAERFEREATGAPAIDRQRHGDVTVAASDATDPLEPMLPDEPDEPMLPDEPGEPMLPDHPTEPMPDVMPTDPEVHPPLSEA
jgi:hypothetical protein